jgi:hypothetical protein
MEKSSRPLAGDASGLVENPHSGPAAPRTYLVRDVRLYREGLISSLARQRQLEIVGDGGQASSSTRSSSCSPKCCSSISEPTRA